MKDIVTVTEEAKTYISDLLQEHPGKCLAVRINDKGCGGHKYEYALFDWDAQGPGDEVMDWPGARLMIDSSSVMWMIGSTLALESSPWDQRLAWVNPMATATCGCGESFSLTGSGGCGS